MVEREAEEEGEGLLVVTSTVLMGGCRGVVV